MASKSGKWEGDSAGTRSRKSPIAFTIAKSMGVMSGLPGCNDA
jgi:hypothetical protein